MTSSSPSRTRERRRTDGDHPHHQAPGRQGHRDHRQPRIGARAEADAHLDAAVAEERPVAQPRADGGTTAALALGDALAVALLDARGFGADDFARSPPRRQSRSPPADPCAGRRRRNPPFVAPDAPVAAAILEISRGGIGMTAVVDERRRVLGIFTDGDLRRAFEKDIDLRALTVADVMTAKPAPSVRTSSRSKPSK